MKIKNIPFLLSIAFLLPGCIYEDLSECQPKEEESAVFLILACEEEAGGGEAFKALKRADFYIFDAQDRFVSQLTDSVGPFSSERTYRVPLPAGTYRVVAWANINKALSTAPGQPVAGITTFDELNLSLAELAEAGELQKKATATPPHHHHYRHTCPALLRFDRNHPPEGTTNGACRCPSEA